MLPSTFFLSQSKQASLRLVVSVSFSSLKNLWQLLHCGWNETGYQSKQVRKSIHYLPSKIIWVKKKIKLYIVLPIPPYTKYVLSREGIILVGKLNTVKIKYERTSLCETLHGSTTTSLLMRSNQPLEYICFISHYRLNLGSANIQYIFFLGYTWLFWLNILRNLKLSSTSPTKHKLSNFSFSRTFYSPLYYSIPGAIKGLRGERKKRLSYQVKVELLEYSVTIVSKVIVKISYISLLSSPEV